MDGMDGLMENVAQSGTNDGNVANFSVAQSDIQLIRFCLSKGKMQISEHTI